jgi:hypothetical protein
MVQVGLGRREGTLWPRVALVLVALGVLTWAPEASADVEFCPPGVGAGQCAPPEGLNSQRGLALDHESGRLYVADRGNDRVEAFSESGGFLFAFGAGTLVKPTKVAADEDLASPNHHSVYVVDAGNSRVVRYSSSGSFEAEIAGVESNASIGVGPGGVLYVLDNIAGKERLRRFQPSGLPIVPPPPAECILMEGTGTAVSMAVAPSGAFWVATEGGAEGIRKYDSGCTELLLAAESDELDVNLLAVDEAGGLFAVQGEVRSVGHGTFRPITAYDQTTGAVLRRFAYGRIPDGFRAAGLAVGNGGVGGIFASVDQEDFLVKRLDFPPPPPTLPAPGSLPAPQSMEVEELGSTKTGLVAEVNPEGEEADVHFEYLTQVDWEDQGESFEGPATEGTEPENLGSEGFRLKTSSAQIGCAEPISEAGHPGETAIEAGECLQPATTYRWRVVATDTANPTGSGESTAESTFTTKAAPEFGDLYSTRVGADAARLNSELDPTGVPTTGFFEYVEEETCRKDEEAAEADPAAHCFDHANQAPDEGAGQAPLDFGSSEGPVTRGTTIFPLIPGTVYRYRLIVHSPLIEPLAGEAVGEVRTFRAPQVRSCSNDASRSGAAAYLPDCRAYEMVSPPDKEGGDTRVLETTHGQPAVLEQASPSGDRLAYGSARSFGGSASAPFTSQYIARRVAGLEWQTHPIDPPRGEPILATIGQTNTEFKAFSTDLCEVWLTSFAEFPPPTPPGYFAGYSNLLRRGDELCNGGTADYLALAPVSEPGGIAQKKDFVTEPLETSADGGHVLFLTSGRLAPQGTNGKRQLYESVGGAAPRLVCILPGGGAVGGACAGGSATSAGEPGAQTGRISADGRRIFWSVPGADEGKLYVRIDGSQTIPVSEDGEGESGTNASQFWGAAADGSVAIFGTRVGPESSDLYEFDVDGEETHPIAGGVVGVMGVSEDASRVYFASTDVLTGEETNSHGEKARAAEPNLYLYRSGGVGSFRFIAPLAGADLGRSVLPERYDKHTARVSPDGSHAAFESVAPLTGYDNKSAVGGTPTQEVYRYDAGTERLACVSCNPSGARPSGPSQIPPWETASHAARVLSDDGTRLFFGSADALAARDTDGTVDVYEWEEEGAGGCKASDATFSPASEGCVELTSSGQSSFDSRFVEASPSGNDVFFATASSLLPQDAGVVDIYDARVEGGLPTPIPPRPPCEGDACHAAVPAPAESTPASSDYTAPPSAAKLPNHRCPKGGRPVHSKGKVRCVRKHHRAHSHRGAG